jgi:hypothetical protein
MILYQENTQSIFTTIKESQQLKIQSVNGDIFYLIEDESLAQKKYEKKERKRNRLNYL